MLNNVIYFQQTLTISSLFIFILVFFGKQLDFSFIFFLFLIFFKFEIVELVL